MVPVRAPTRRGPALLIEQQAIGGNTTAEMRREKGSVPQRTSSRDAHVLALLILSEHGQRGHREQMPPFVTATTFLFDADGQRWMRAWDIGVDGSRGGEVGGAWYGRIRGWVFARERISAR